MPDVEPEATPADGEAVDQTPSDPADEPTSDPTSDPTSQPEKKKGGLPVWAETGLLLVLAILLAVGIKTFFLQAFYIPSASMEPGLLVNDRILVEKPSYWSGGPERGDVVVFADPGDWLTASEDAGPTSPVAKVLAKIGLYPSGGHLVKRVIGVAGDTIVCCDSEGRLSINGVPLDGEGDYVKRLSKLECAGPMTSTCDWTAGPVPEGHIFVMGDNRGNSSDSTVHMCPPNSKRCVPGDEFVSDDLVVGKVFAVIWPASHFRILHRPDGFASIPDAS